MTRTSLAKVTEGLLVRMVAMTVWVGRIGSMAGKKGSESVDGMQRDNVNVVCWIKDRLPDFCHNLCSKIAFENRIPVLLVVCDVIKPLRKASMIQYDIFKLSAVTYRENLPDLLYISRSQQRFFFSIWVFFHGHSRFTGQQGKGVSISLLSSTSSFLALIRLYIFI